MRKLLAVAMVASGCVTQTLEWRGGTQFKFPYRVGAPLVFAVTDERPGMTATNAASVGYTKAQYDTLDNVATASGKPLTHDLQAGLVEQMSIEAIAVKGVDLVPGAARADAVKAIAAAAGKDALGVLIAVSRWLIEDDAAAPTLGFEAQLLVIDGTGATRATTSAKGQKAITVDGPTYREGVVGLHPQVGQLRRALDIAKSDIFTGLFMAPEIREVLAKK